MAATAALPLGHTILRAALVTGGLLAAGPGLANTERRINAVVETFTCANLRPQNALDPTAVRWIGRSILSLTDADDRPEGAAGARVVLRLCFNQSIDQPVIDVIAYSGPPGDIATATQKFAKRSVRRALDAGLLTVPLRYLADGEPHRAVVDLVFGAPEERPAADPAQ
ncbi:hypothetical protein [Pseudogemmobacter bohemicus]|uniref:hypothetical protein n=1 Tax=Pseudogemmobacter bohemicus TaxID=2250708 RepID=UPI000DD470C1|nr:hypothetical protein [Pseudogemmobacter bohemicus]